MYLLDNTILQSSLGPGLVLHSMLVLLLYVGQLQGLVLVIMSSVRVIMVIMFSVRVCYNGNNVQC